MSARQSSSLRSHDLLVNLAEQVKQPFVQIAFAAEQLEAMADSTELETIQQQISGSTHAALSLIDGYLLAVELQQRSQLDLESVSLSSVAYDVSDALAPYAQLQNCDLSVHLQGRYGPVMAHREAVFHALKGLVLSFIDAQHESHPGSVTLAVKRNSQGMSIGVYGAHANLTPALLQKAKALQGHAKQPFAAVDAQAGTGIFIAETLFERVRSRLHVSKLQGSVGLAATLQPSQQLVLL